VLRLAVPGGQEGLLFSTTDGKLLWKDQRRAPNSFFVDDRYYGPKSFYESATGKELGEASHEGGGCGMVTWVPGMQAGLSHVALGMKSPCGVGAYAAGGMVLFAPSQCDCWPHLRGAAGFIAAGELIPAHPLETGAALAPMLAAKSNDWPQYRGNVWRTGEAAISLGQSAQVRWVAKAVQSLPVPAGHELQRMEWLDRPTPPVTAGGLAFYGVSDGSLRAVKTVDGQPAWTFWTGGAVLTSPAVSGGRVYAGSADGWVYCLDAATGQLAWRWRGAPAERRIMIYGKLMSSWPVTAVLVDQGVLYGVAGQWMQNGSVTFALDATTGKPHWQTWTGPNWDGRKFLQGENPGFGPAGQLALVGNNLWVRTYLGLPAAFEKATGRRVHPTDELIQLQARQEWSFGVRLATAGQDILVVNDRLVLQGGQPLLVNPDIRHDKSAARFIAYYLNERGQIPVKPLSRPAIPSSQVAPAISGKQLLIVGGIGRSWRSENSTIGLSLWSLDVWQKEFESATSEGGVADDEAADASAKAGKKKWEARKSSPAEQDLRSGFCLALDMKKAIWRADSADISAIALGPDAAVAVVGEPKTKGKLRYGESPAYEGWKLIAFDRASGKERWSAALPGEPVFNGLAPAGDGSWVVTLRDGALAIVSGARASAR
jgi:outer membrane protein assembly factor BamB